jgi:hypothetical protein
MEGKKYDFKGFLFLTLCYSLEHGYEKVCNLRKETGAYARLKAESEQERESFYFYQFFIKK